MSDNVQGDDVAEYEFDERRTWSLPLISDNTDSIIRKYKLLLPDYLQVDHVDVLILNAPGDVQLARKLECFINALIFPIGLNNIVHQGKAVLLDEAVPHVRSKVAQLDEAINYTTVMCAILTPEFLTTEEHRHTGSASFWNTTQNKLKKDCFLLAFGSPRTSVGQIPAYFDQLNTSVDLSLPDDELKRILQRQISCFLNKRLKRDRLQKQERINHLISNGIGSRSELDHLAWVSTNDMSGSEEYNAISLDEWFQSGGRRILDKSDYGPLANTSSVLNRSPSDSPTIQAAADNLEDGNQKKLDPAYYPWLFLSLLIVITAVVVFYIYSS